MTQNSIKEEKAEDMTQIFIVEEEADKITQNSVKEEAEEAEEQKYIDSSNLQALSRSGEVSHCRYNLSLN